MGATPARLIRELQQFRRKIAERYAVEGMILFGSRARGDVHPFSDVDLIVVSERFRRKDHIGRAYPLHLEWDLPYPVDFLCYTPEEFRELSRRPSIVKLAMQEGIAIPG